MNYRILEREIWSALSLVAISTAATVCTTTTMIAADADTESGGTRRVPKMQVSMKGEHIDEVDSRLDNHGHDVSYDIIALVAIFAARSKRSFSR